MFQKERYDMNVLKTSILIGINEKKTQNVDCRVEKNLECISSSLWPLANHSILNSIFQILHWKFIYGINRSKNWQNKCHSSNYEMKKRIDSIRSWDGKWIRNVIFMANGWLQSLWLIKMMMQVLHIFWGLNFLKLPTKDSLPTKLCSGVFFQRISHKMQIVNPLISHICIFYGLC